ncbi:tail fiber assembly protein [Enterobacter asburiae]|uniref:tail fiber assembly protein n=1 Tax=Scandinavium sp. UTDF21-P1B TaxID=3446379 RepID=UPI00348BDCC8
MNKYTYSASLNAFFPVVLKVDYEKAGSWPDDGVEVPDEMAEEFMSEPPAGKVRVAGSNGFPAWADTPAPTHEEVVAAAEQYSQQLLRQIDDVTADWRVELMLGDISDEDKEKLSEWMAYKKALKAVDISTAPDVIWPPPPAE